MRNLLKNYFTYLIMKLCGLSKILYTKMLLTCKALLYHDISF